MAPPEMTSRLATLEQDLAFYRKQEEVYKNLLDRLNVGLITLKNGNIVTANQKIVNILGYNLIDFLGLHISTICPVKQPNDKTSAELLENAFKTAIRVPVDITEWHFKTKSNKPVICDLVINSSRIDNDNFLQVEIHETYPKKLAVKKLKEKNKEIESLSEERESLNEELRATLDELVEVNKQLTESDAWNKSIVDNIPLGLLVINKNVIEHANDKIIELLGFSEYDLEGRTLSDFELKEDIDLLSKFISARDKSITEFWIESKKGKKSYIRNQYVTLNHENRWMVIITDLTGEKLKEQEVLSSRERLEFAIEANQSVIWDIDFNKPDQKYGDNFGRLFGYEHGELKIDKNFWAEMIHPDDFSKVMHSLSEHYNGVIPYYESECRVKTKKGDYKWVLSRGKVFNIDENGQPSRFIGMFVDISERKSAEEALHDTENRFSLAVQNASVVFFTINSEGIFTLSEGRGLSKLNLVPGQVVGQKVRDVYKDYPNVLLAIDQALSGKPFTGIISVGDIFFDTHISSIFDEKGKVKAIVGVANDITEMKQAEENLRFSEEKFRTIVQHLTDIILIVDKTLTIKYESPAVARVFGYEPGALVGKNGLNFIHPEDHNIVLHEFEQVLKRTNDFKPTELRVKHKKGHYVYLEILGDNLLNHPAVGGILLTARDVTERKENEVQLGLYRNHLEQLVKKRTEEIELMNAELIAINEELKSTNEELADKNDILNEEITKRIEAQLMLEESENKFRSFIEQSTEGIALIDETGKIADWNKGMESIFRISKNEIINTFIWEFDYRFLPEKRKTAEQFEELKNSILEYLSNIDKTKVMTVEGVFHTMELKQKYLNVTIFPVITQKHKYVGRIVRDITGIRRAQEEIEKQSEELRFINENLEQQKTQLEKTLSELQKTQAQLIQSEKMASLGVLTAGVAHEINNPVNYINTALEGLKITLADFLEIFHKYEEINIDNVDQKISEVNALKKKLDYNLLQEGINILLNNMQTGIERITEIVKSLRTFARVEENELKYSNIHELLDTTLVMLHNQYKNRIEIIKDYGVIPSVNCYPGKLSQVFMNLLSNAIHAIPQKGKITIKTRISPDNSLLTISVKDTGIGIPEQVKSKIFEPFFTTKEAGKGTGLGLSITYGIIQQHRGNIEVESKDGNGTEFLITLPATL